MCVWGAQSPSASFTLIVWNAGIRVDMVHEGIATIIGILADIAFIFERNAQPNKDHTGAGVDFWHFGHLLTSFYYIFLINANLICPQIKRR